jgi:hypothetical protein
MCLFRWNITLSSFVLHKLITKRRGRVINTPASYLEVPGFKSWPGDLLS